MVGLEITIYSVKKSSFIRFFPVAAIKDVEEDQSTIDDEFIKSITNTSNKMIHDSNIIENIQAKKKYNKRKISQNNVTYRKLTFKNRIESNIAIFYDENYEKM